MSKTWWVRLRRRMFQTTSPYQYRKHKKRDSSPSVETLEERDVPAAGFTPDHVLLSQPNDGGFNPFSNPSGYSPSQMRHAYGFDQISFNGTTGDGSGTTIAIVDAYNNPTVSSDLHTFDQQFGLSDPNFTVVNQTGGSTLPSENSSWAGEIDLDVQWAHATAPGANILLVEASSNSYGDLLSAVQYAAKQSGVVAVSMSWGGGEFSSETAYDSFLAAPSTNPGVVFVNSSGDSGAPASYPSTSPNVLSVGGTSLSLNSDSTYSSESAWSGSGGGISAYESQPSYQQGVVTQSTTKRTSPDVAYDADPNTGVPVYQTDGNGSGGWLQYGGTSAAAPQWAALIAIADQGRALAGKSALSTSTLMPMLYGASSSDFHDVTTGSSSGSPSESAGTGYDLATGLGTPVANRLVPDLVVSSTSNPTATHFSISAPSSATAGNSFSVTITALDANNHQVSGYTGTVHFTSSDGLAGLPSNYTFTSTDAGSHTFTITLKTAGSQTLTATDTSTSSIVGNATISVTPGAASSLKVSGFPSSVTAGSSGTVTVTALDAFGNTATGYTGTVHFTSSDGSAVLPANATLTNGVGTFTVTFDTAGTQSVTVTDTANSSLTGSESGITVNPGSTTHLAFLQQPSNVTAGTSISPAVKVEELDQFNNVVTTDSSSQVSLAFGSNPGGATLSGGSAVTVSHGVATFSSVSANLVGTGDTLVASSGSLNVTSSSFNVTPGAAVSLQVSGFPSSVTAGSSGTVTITALDAFGNTATGYTGTIHFTSSDSNAVLPANATLTNGVGTFSVTFDTAGTQSVTATDTNTSSIAGSESGITVNPGSTSHLAFLQQPSNVSVGGTISPAVKVEELDQFNNVVTTDSSSQISLAFGSNPGSATLSGGSAVTVTHGVATFSSLSVSAAGTGYTLKASSGSLSSTSSSFNVVAGAAASLKISAPSSATAGNSFSVTITALDANGNTANGYTGTVHFTSSDGLAGLPSNYTFTSTDAGSHTFTITLKTAGSQTLTATDTSTSSIKGSATLSVAAGAATSLQVSGFPSSVTAGSSGTVTVTALDAFGNTATGYTGTVHFTSSDGSAVLPANATLTNGVGTFTVTFDTAGTQSVTVTDTANSSLTGSESGITVNPGATTHLVFLQQPSNVTAGTSISPAVKVEELDQFNNVVTTDSSSQISLTFGANPGGATLSGGSAVTVSHGVATFSSVSANLVGTGDTLVASSGSLNVTSSSFNVTPGAAVSLQVSGFPSSVTAGSAGTVTVTALDANGNTATGYTGTVHFTSSDSNAVLPANATLTNGVATFSVTFDTAGTQSVTATDTANSSLTGSESGITVNPGSTSHLVFLQQPSNVSVGGTISPAVKVEELDQFNNVVTTDSSSQVSLAFGSNPGNATLSGGGTVTVSHGVATFSSLSVSAAGTGYTLKANSGSLSSTSSAFNVVAGAATSLKVSGFPSSVTAGTSATVTVTALDANGNTATGYTGTVHFTSSDSNAVLPANATLTNGVATFTVMFKTAGSQTLTATDTATSSITGSESGITVNPGSTTSLIFMQQPSNAKVGGMISPAVKVEELDQFNNIVTTDNSSQLSLAFGSNPGGGTLSGGGAVTVSHGVATFNSLSVNAPGNGYTLGAHSGSMSAMSSAFNVTSSSNVVEDFESGLSNYTHVGSAVPRISTKTAAAHDGTYGLDIAGDGNWYFRKDSGAVVNPGDTLSAWVQLKGSANGRAYLGFGTTLTGTMSVVLAPNTNQFLVESSPKFTTFKDLATAKQKYSANQWYRVELDWGTSGTVVAKLFASNGTTLLNSLTVKTGNTTPGWFAFRATGSDKYFDTVTVTQGVNGFVALPPSDGTPSPAQSGLGTDTQKKGSGNGVSLPPGGEAPTPHKGGSQTQLGSPSDLFGSDSGSVVFDSLPDLV